MVAEPTNIDDDIDPLNDSIETIRAKRAEKRLGDAVEGQGVEVHHQVDKSKNKNHIGSAYADSLFSSAGTFGKPAWSDSMGGRAAIRLVSRGIFGAAFYAIAGRMSRAQLQNYNPETFELKTAAPLEVVAKGFDTIFGKPIAGAARGVARLSGKSAAEAEKWAWNSVNFRTKAYYPSIPGQLNSHGNPSNGRSLGAEITSISFDFAMMSVGDAMVRNFVQMIDPNIPKTWWLNDKGEVAGEHEKRHFSLSKWTQSTGLAAWRIFSKNQGEDWAVALPYVYQMRMQRHFLSKAFGAKGAKLEMDNAWNGAGFKVNNAGKIIGDYQLMGAIDLHARFVGYNVYTLMFREAHATIAHAFKHWKEGGYKLQFHMPEHIDPFDRARKGVRYLVKSFIKANMYMNPAVIPFWLMRTPQTKHRSGFINVDAEKGESAIAAEHSMSDRIASAGANSANMLAEIEGSQIINFSTKNDRAVPYKIAGAAQPKKMYLGDRAVDHAMTGFTGPYDKAIYAGYEKGFATSFSKFLNPIGRMCYNLGTKATQLAHSLPEGCIKNFIGIEEGTLKGCKPVISAVGRETFMRNMVDASLAYTPYFYAKAELGLRVDDRPSDGSLGHMDKAIYKFMDNTAKLNLHGMKNSLKEMWHLSTTINRDPISREGGLSEAEKKMRQEAAVATTPSTSISAEGSVHHKPAELSRDPQHDNGNNDRQWAEHVAGRSLAAQFIPTSTTTRH
jgi:hypothetical protein